MKVIFAQGNPGAKFAPTRHNVGWRFLDAYAEKREVIFQEKNKFQAEIAEFETNDEKVLLVKPLTMYNDTGNATRALANFYKLTPADFLIVHDELALPLGTLRTRLGGSDAGNNGIKSLNASLGKDTARLRIGIYNPETTRDALSTVLGTFTADEIAILNALQPTIFEIIDGFILNQFSATTYNTQSS
ncbi:MAG TPA: aminoacyl-tRNA hydrolase [Candidatus Saccharimonadaceae bacterium]|nr:aminoacyl-tRNA hydrolase [Candidatus Saccharimonadaceae bacterium]